jgi:Uma2 family endonuclease
MGVMRQRGVVMDKAEIEYPESDGQPMAETELHWREMVDLALMLKERYRDAPDVYVSSNMFLYWREGDPSAVMAPDVFVVFGVPKELRRTYKLWLAGVAPAIVMEVTSRKTRREDLVEKKATCARLGVAEYWLYDPEGEYLRPSLQGFRLVAGEYRTVVADERGALPSAALGLTLHLEQGLLVLTDGTTGERLDRPVEAVARARAAAEAERRGAELERRRAEAMRAQLAEALARAEAAEARLAELGGAPDTD